MQNNFCIFLETLPILLIFSLNLTDQEIPSDYRLEFLKPIVLRSQHLAVLSQTAVTKPPEPDSESAGAQAAVSKKLALEGRISCRAECKTAQTGSNEVYMKVHK